MFPLRLTPERQIGRTTYSTSYIRASQPYSQNKMISSQNHTKSRLPILLPAPPGIRKRTVPVPKRARVTAACEVCRTRKSKCNGRRPKCDKCISHDTPCHYVETENRQIRQMYKALHDRQSAYEELFNCLRTMAEKDSVDVLCRIRAGQDIKTILDHVKGADLLIQLSSTSKTPRE